MAINTSNISFIDYLWTKKNSDGTLTGIRLSKDNLPEYLADPLPIVAGKNISITSTDGSIEISAADGKVKTVNTIGPDENGDVTVPIPTAGTTASAVKTTASGGSATTWSKSDHVHSISLATGDSNGQVKIAGTNVSVKGLGSAAYTASTAYAAASHTHTINQVFEPSFQSSATLTTRTLFNIVRANRLMFLPADQIIVEKSTDAGQTWVSANYTDAQKEEMFAGRNTGNFAIPQIDGKQNVNCMLRVTITGMKYNVPANTPETEKYNYWNSSYVESSERYCQLRTLYFWVNAVNNTVYCTVQRATGANANNWITIFDTGSNANYVGMTGWTGMDFVTFTVGVFGGAKSQTGNYWNYRIIFRTASTTATAADIFNQEKLKTSYLTYNQSIAGIMGYGDTVWTSPNQFMSTDHLYAWDRNQTMIVPKDLRPNTNGTQSLGTASCKWLNVYATTFTENGTTLANKYLGKTAKAADSDKLDGYDSTYFQPKLTTQTAYSAKGSAIKIPQITTNSLGQVTKINEIEMNKSVYDENNEILTLGY